MRKHATLTHERIDGIKISKETMMYGLPILSFLLLMILAQLSFSNLYLIVILLVVLGLVSYSVYSYYTKNIQRRCLSTIDFYSDFFYIKKEVSQRGLTETVMEIKVYYANIKYIKEDWKAVWEYDLMTGKIVSSSNVVVSRKDEAFIYLVDERGQLCGKFEVMETVGYQNYRYFINHLISVNPSIQLSNYVKRFL